jgi:oligopeptide transport system substrate-binding protein
VPEKTITEFQDKWTLPENIVTSGAFKLKEWTPYHQIVVEKNQNYWDAASVKLQQIKFYPVEQQATVMNLYKAGEIDATYNRSVPRSWLFMMQKKLDHQDAIEASIEYYVINVTKPPMNDVRVRKAFAIAIDRTLLTATRRNSKPLSTLVPTDIFKGYPSVQAVEFNPEKAKKLLAEAGYRDAAGNYDPSKFPIEEITINFNTSEGQSL